MQSIYDKKKLEYLFEINDDLEIVFNKEDAYITIDNFYKNFEDLHEFVNKLKKTPRGNFNEKYINTRTRLNIKLNNKIKLNNIIATLSEKYLGRKDVLTDETVLINSIMLNSIIDHNMQHWPHRDPGITGIIYLDKINAGGTAIYMDPDETMDENYILTTLGKGAGYFRDTSGMKIKKLIPSKNNMLVILDATKLHGGYMLDHTKYLNNERIHQIVFTVKNNIDN